MNDSASEFCARCGADGQNAEREALEGEPSSVQLFPQLPVESASGTGAGPRPGETIEQSYLRQIRNAVVFIAWIIGFIFVAYLILGIIIARNS
jgi:hypothetical protein